MSAPDVSVVAVVRDAAELAAVLAAVPVGPAVELVVVHPRSVAVPLGVRSVPLERPGRGRAHGLAAAAGRAVVFLEPGDRLLPGALEAELAALDDDPACAFVHGRVRGLPGSAPGNEESQLTRTVHVDHYVELLRGDVVGPSCAVLFRRSALGEAGVLDADAAGLVDYALSLRLSRGAPVRSLRLTVAESARAGQGAGLAELAALRRERRHLGSDEHALAAHRDGMTALIARAGVRTANDLRRGVPDRRRALVRTLRFCLLVAGQPRGLRGFLRVELLPWLARRRPGSRLLHLLAGADGAVAGLHPAARIAEVVRHSVPPRAPVAVLGRPDPDLRLGAREVRFVTSPDEATEEEFLLVPRTSSWELARSGVDLSGRTAVWADETCALYGARSARAVGDRVLVAGYFSFEEAHATAGDLLVRDQLCAWLDRAGRVYDVAHARPFVGGVHWRTADPTLYSTVVFACGPFSPDLPSWELLDRFPDARAVGVNLSMLRPLEEWNPFDALIERDSSRTSRPDVAFGTREPPVPVVGVCLREQAPGTRTADAAIRRLIASTPLAAVRIDTRLDLLHGGTNSTGQRTAAEVESLLARMDVVVTTRLHGLVLALKNGVPVVAVDPGNEGFKIRRQAESVGWPVVFGADEVTDEGLRAALEFCRTDEARALAVACGARGAAAADEVRRMLEAELVRDRTGTGN